MPDLTDSYCERCGARYVFSPPVPKSLSLKGARVLAKGLKNFVLTDGQSMADSLTLARSEDEHEDSTRITEAFHRTFNFCMTCRQYACDKCWNTRVGACLSCAPAAGSPVAPEDHLIVRTPVAQWDTDWSIFPDGPAVEPVGHPSTAPFNAPILFSDPETAPQQEAEAPAAQGASAWPLIDLPLGAPAASLPVNGRGNRRSASKQVDPEAASLWPITDEIAPEMTLTPEELELVESRLSPEIPPSQAPSRPAAPEPQIATQPAPLPTPLAPAPVAPAAQAPARPTPEPPQPGWAAAGPTRNATSGPEWVAKNVEPRGLPATQAYDGFIEDDPGQDQGRGLEDAAAASGRILRMPTASPSLPPLARPAPQPPINERSPFVARLLGRHTATPDGPGFEQPTRAARRKGQPSGDPWPQATPWSERPAEVHDWWDAPARPTAAVRPAPPVPDLPQPPAQEPARATILRGKSPVDVDARSAAAVRLSAVASTDDAPAIPQDDAAPAEAPAPAPRPIQPPLSDITSAASPPLSHAASDSASGPLGHWPPLGSSWPATDDPKAPWAGPGTPSVLSVVAAQQAEPPTVSEMWAQSSQEVLNRGSVRVCHRCALPVSTQARFCRRCGTQQA